MKKNITINLSGRLFQIDEDAYELLQQYINSLRSSFGHQDGGDEIVDDIEARIAELFDELKANGTVAITIDHVKDIVTRIGKPEQLAGGDEQDGKSQNGTKGDAWDEARSAAQDMYNNVRTRTAGKKLYRNPDDKMVAGVMSGLAAYTGTDVTWWRLGMVVFTMFFGMGILAYIVLAIVLPQANLPEEKLKMQGMEVTPQNLADAVMDHQAPQRQSEGWLRETFSVVLKLIIGFCLVIAIITGVSLVIAFVGVLIALIVTLVAPSSAIVSLPFSMGDFSLMEAWHEHTLLCIGFALSMLTVLFIPIYSIIYGVLSYMKKIKPMGVIQRIVCIVLWFVALALTCRWGYLLSLI